MMQKRTTPTKLTFSCLLLLIAVWCLWASIHWLYVSNPCTDNTEIPIEELVFKKPLFVLGINSVDTERRELVRATWVQQIKLLKDELPFKVEYKFVLDKISPELAEENKLFGDMLFLSKANSTAKKKVYNWYHYVIRNYQEFLLVSWMDDFTFLCIPQIFNRIFQVRSRHLAYGWSFDAGLKQENLNLFAEFFLVLGKDIVKRIVEQRYCVTKSCGTNDVVTDAIDQTVGKQLSQYKVVQYMADNDKMVHSLDTESMKRHIKLGVCSRYVLFHKVQPRTMMELKMMNTQAIGKPNGFGLSEGVTGGLFKPGARPEPVPVLLNRPLSKKDNIKNCDKWAVSTTINSITSSVKLLAKLNSWCVVIVADTRSLTKKDYIQSLSQSFSDIFIYLSVEEQETLYPQLTYFIPKNNFGRKNVGYMYAIHHGAKYIWDFDDDNEGVPDLNIFNKKYAQLCTGNNNYLANPYPHFGVSEEYLWPRGLPLENIKDPTTLLKDCNKTEKTQRAEVSIVQCLASIEPDVDAIYRLTRNHPINFTATQESHKPLVIPKHVFTPFNAQATLWRSPAFLYMALPVTVNGRVSDIWRSYIAQYFLHQNDQHLAFVAPCVIHERNNHNYIKDFNAELDLYQKSSLFVELLHKRKDYKELKSLYTDFYKNGILEMEDIDFIQAWTDTFKHVTN